MREEGTPDSGIGLRPLRLALALGLSLYPLPSTLYPAFAQRLKDAKQRELQKVMQELQERRSEIDGYRREESDLERELVRIEGNQQRSRERLRRIKSDLAAAHRQLGELEARAQAIGLALAGGRAAWDEGLRILFLRDQLQSSYFGAEELWSGALLRASLAAQADYLLDLQGIRSETDWAARDLQNRRRKLEVRAQDELRERNRQEALLREKRQDLKTTTAKREAALRRMRELEETAEALNQFLVSLDKRRRPGRAGGPPVARHSLPWPVQGRLAAGFGKQTVGELETWIIRDGIEIQVPEGAPVRCVKAGTVAYAGPFRSYGTIVVVNHGSGFFSVYGMLGRVVVSKGEVLQALDVVGYAGRPGAGGPPAVYFEVRQNSQALDPLHWLERR